MLCIKIHYFLRGNFIIVIFQYLVLSVFTISAEVGGIVALNVLRMKVRLTIFNFCILISII